MGALTLVGAMADEALAISVLTQNFRRRVEGGSLTLEDLEAISAEATARMLDGTTVIEVTIEGGATRAVTNCDPAVVLAAAEVVISENDGSDGAGVTNSARFLDFSGGRIET